MESMDVVETLGRSSLGTTIVGVKVLYYPAASSTMDIARDVAAKGAEEGVVVIADEQWAGRGRGGRRWLSGRGELALSILLRPHVSRVFSLVMVASLAAVRAISSVTGVEAAIKWPNDVMIGGKKVGGILIENLLAGEGKGYAIIGIGVNCNLDLAAFPEISATATSLSAELGKPVPPLQIARLLLREVEHLYLSDPASLYMDWRARLETLGRQVSVTIGRHTLKGVARDVAKDGSLLVLLPDGREETIVAGDVIQLREVRAGAA